MKSKGKFLACGIILCMLFAMAIVPASAATGGKCGDNLTWEFTESQTTTFSNWYIYHTITISGTGDMFNYSEDRPFWRASGDDRLTLIINSGVTSIGDYAFVNCNYYNYSITIPNSVTRIGNGAFYRCNLTSITIPNGVTSIGNNAFSGCRLNWISIPNSVTSIGDSAFAHNTSVSNISIGSGVKSIGKWAFANLSPTTIYYYGTPAQWKSIAIDPTNTNLLNAKIYYIYDLYEFESPQDNNGETVTLPLTAVLDTGENLNFRNGYVNTGNGYVRAGYKKITGDNVYFNDEGKIRMQDGDNAKVEKDNGDGTTDQGFIVGVFDPTGIIRMILEVSGEVNEVDYTGRTITKDFDFTGSEIYGLVNFGFEVKRLPKPLELTIQRIE